jgi:23S rRNA (uracil1939-C5)-methyltransferase
MSVKKYSSKKLPDIYEVDIENLVYGGDAIGRLPDGRAVFVPFALPGEKVKLQITQQKRNHAKAKLVEILDASDIRSKPICEHFGECGGCHYQHIPYENQVSIKTSILTEQIQRIAGIELPPVSRCIPAVQPRHYRNTMQYHLSLEGGMGLFASGSDHIIPIKECDLPIPIIDNTRKLLDIEPSSQVERIEIRVGTDNEVLLAFGSTNSNLPEFSVDLPISAVHLGEDGNTVLSGDEYVVIEVKERIFQVTAGSYFQVNTPVATAMVDYILDLVQLNPQSVVLDLYCGGGLFSAFIAPHVSHCVGVDSSPFSASDFIVNLDEFDNVTLYQGNVEDVLPVLKLKTDIILVDPPRSGLSRAAMDALMVCNAELIVYISSDPATLSRDVKRMVGNGYSLEQISPFDMFPQTAQIESISTLSKRK